MKITQVVCDIYAYNNSCEIFFDDCQIVLEIFVGLNEIKCIII